MLGSFPASKLHCYKKNRICLNAVLGVDKYPLDLVLFSSSILHGFLAEI